VQSGSAGRRACRRQPGLLRAAGRLCFCWIAEPAVGVLLSPNRHGQSKGSGLIRRRHEPPTPDPTDSRSSLTRNRLRSPSAGKKLDWMSAGIGM